MGEIYKQVGGWKGIQKDILFPLAEYQKSQGMDTSFTRLYDAYRKVDPIWRKLHDEKEPPRVGMGDLRVAEAKKGNGGNLFTSLGPSNAPGVASPFLSEAGDESLFSLNQRQQTKWLTTGQAKPSIGNLPDFFSGEKRDYFDLLRGESRYSLPFNGILPRPEGGKEPWEINIPRPTWMDVFDIIIGRGRKQWPTRSPLSGGILYANEHAGGYDTGARGWEPGQGGGVWRGNNSSDAAKGSDWVGGQEKANKLGQYGLRNGDKMQSYAMANHDDGIKQAGFLEPAAKVVKEWWLDVDKFGDRVYKTALMQGKSSEQAERARSKAMKHYRGYKSIALTGSAAAKAILKGWKGDVAAATGILASPDDTIKDDTEAWAIRTCDEDDEEQMRSIGLP